MALPDYAVIITTRNLDSDEYGRTIRSIRNQTHGAISICTIRDDQPGIDFSRLPKMWNQALERFKQEQIAYEWFLIMPDDLELEPRYAERLLNRAAKDLVIMSGDVEPFNTGAPQGGGRFVRRDWFEQNYSNGVPEKLGYESEMLDRAHLTGKQSMIWNNVHMIHLRPLGSQHGFSEFGQAMKTCGYYPLFALWRCFNVMQNKNIGKLGGLRILWHYLKFRPAKTGYYSNWDQQYRAFTRDWTRKQLINVLGDRLLPT